MTGMSDPVWHCFGRVVVHYLAGAAGRGHTVVRREVAVRADAAELPAVAVPLAEGMVLEIRLHGGGPPGAAEGQVRVDLVWESEKDSPAPWWPEPEPGPRASLKERIMALARPESAQRSRLSHWTSRTMANFLPGMRRAGEPPVPGLTLQGEDEEDPPRPYLV